MSEYVKANTSLYYFIVMILYAILLSIVIKLLPYSEIETFILLGSMTTYLLFIFISKKIFGYRLSGKEVSFIIHKGFRTYQTEFISGDRLLMKERHILKKNRRSNAFVISTLSKRIGTIQGNSMAWKGGTKLDLVYWIESIVK